MKHSTRPYAISIVMAVIQLFDPGSFTFGLWALLALVFARVCEGAEEWQEQQSRHKG